MGPRKSTSLYVKKLCTKPLITSALVGGVDASGKSIFAGRKATGFTNAEEIAVGKVQVSGRQIQSYSGIHLFLW
jgi:hypothetical protein